jgi:hypothetical protein
MKLFLFLFVICNLSISACSQLTKNNWLVGGNGKLFSDNSDYSSASYTYSAKHTQIDVSASVGYFFVDKLAIGFRPTFSSLKAKVTSIGGGTTNTRRFWFGPFTRYYFLQEDKQFNLLADLGYQFGFLKSGQEKGNLNTFNACAGPVIYFNNCIGLEFLFGYAYSKEGVKERGKLVNKGFQTAIGFQIHLGK